MLTKEQYAPYDRTKLSKAPGIDIEKVDPYITVLAKAEFVQL